MSFHERPKSGPRAAKSAPRERSWRPGRLQEGVLGRSWEDLVSIFETFGGCLGAMLAISLVIFGHLGLILASSWAYLGTSWGYVDAKLSHRIDNPEKNSDFQWFFNVFESPRPTQEPLNLIQLRNGKHTETILLMLWLLL